MPVAATSLLLLALVPAAIGQLDDQKPNMMRSASGWVHVSGPTNVDNLATSRWAEKIGQGTERITGLPLPFRRRRPLRIQLRPRSATGEARVRLRPATPVQGFDQRLVLERYADVSGKEAREALCRLLLNGYIAEAVDRKSTKPTVWVPRLFSEGVAGNLFSSLRASHSDGVIALRNDDRLPSIAEIVAAQNRTDVPADESVRASFVGWLTSFPAHETHFNALFVRLAEGGSVTAEWLAGLVPGCASVADLESGWEQWVDRQKQMVYVPGMTTTRMVQDLEFELLLRPGECGIPATGGILSGTALDALIARRSETWIPTFAAAKCATLKIMMIGRGEQFRLTADAYCRYLQALAHGRSERRLQKHLAEAKEALTKLQEVQEENIP